MKSIERVFYRNRWNPTEMGSNFEWSVDEKINSIDPIEDKSDEENAINNKNVHGVPLSVRLIQAKAEIEEWSNSLPDLNTL